MTLIEARNAIFAADPTRSVCVGVDCYRHPALGSGREPYDDVRYTVTIHDDASPAVYWQESNLHLSVLVADALARLRDPDGTGENPQIGDEIVAAAEVAT